MYWRKSSLVIMTLMLVACGTGDEDGGNGSTMNTTSESGSGSGSGSTSEPPTVIDTSAYDGLTYGYIPLGVVRFFQPSSGRQVGVAVQNPVEVSNGFEFQEYREYDQRHRYFRFTNNTLYLLRAEIDGDVFDFEELNRERCFATKPSNHDYPIIASTSSSINQTFVVDEDCSVREAREVRITISHSVSGGNKEVCFTARDKDDESYLSCFYVSRNMGVTSILEDAGRYQAGFVRDDTIL